MGGEKHTPGPWVIDETKVEHGCCWSTAIFAPDSNGYYGGPGELVAEANDANAHLIAAAPELLEALGHFMCCTTILPNGEIIGLKREHFEAARAAIAKATGN
jgi:hypothetical protein